MKRYNNKQSSGSGYSPSCCFGGILFAKDNRKKENNFDTMYEQAVGILLPVVLVATCLRDSLTWQTAR